MVRVRDAFPSAAVGLTLAALGRPSTPQDAGAAVAEAAVSVRVTAEARDGSRRLVELTASPVESLAALGAVALAYEATDERADTTRDAGAWLVLRGGDRLGVRVLGGRGDRLDVGVAAAGEHSFDVDAVEALHFPLRVPRGWRGSLDGPEQGDRLYWVRGAAIERIDGTLAAFEAEGVRFESVLGARLFPWGEIAALFVEALAPAPERERVAGALERVAVDLQDGGRIHGELAALSGRGADLLVAGGVRLSLTSAAVREIALDDGSFVFVSDLEPARAVEGWPPDDGFGLSWPWRRDRSVTGDALRVGGTTFARGIGVHAPSRLEYALDGAFEVLRGQVAIDDSTALFARRGSVEFSIYLDDASAPAWRSGRVRGGDPPLAIPPVALAGARRLALQVEMDEDSYVADRADWLRLVLVRR